MRLADTYNARKALAVAIAKVQAAAEELKKPGLSDQEKFEVVWTLGHVELRDLEEFRIPD